MLVYNPKNVVGPGGSSEKICHVMNAKSADLVLENYDRVSENVPEDDPFDIDGKSINLKKLVIKAFQRGRPTAVAVNAFVRVPMWSPIRKQARHSEKEPPSAIGSEHLPPRQLAEKERPSAIDKL